MSTTLLTLLWGAAGVFLGYVYLFLVHRTVVAIGDEAGWIAAILPLVLRAGLAVAVFFAAATFGATELVAALCGFLLVRTVIIARAKRP